MKSSQRKKTLASSLMNYWLKPSFDRKVKTLTSDVIRALLEIGALFDSGESLPVSNYNTFLRLEA